MGFLYNGVWGDGPGVYRGVFKRGFPPFLLTAESSESISYTFIKRAAPVKSGGEA